jgi:hypothetical protein
MMVRDGYDLRTIYDDHGVAMGFIWRKQGYAKWGAVLAGHCECCAPQRRLGAFATEALAAAAVAAGLKTGLRQ